MRRQREHGAAEVCPRTVAVAAVDVVDVVVVVAVGPGGGQRRPTFKS